MSELDKGERMVGEGGGKDRLIVKHGREWRVRTVEKDALATDAPTRDGEPTSPLGGGCCITVVALDANREVERGPDGRPLPLATTMLVVQPETLARAGFDPLAAYLERMHEAVDAAAVRRANIDGWNAFREEFMTQPEDLITPPADTPPEPAPPPAPEPVPPAPPFLPLPTAAPL